MHEPPAAPPSNGPSPTARPPAAALAALAALRERFIGTAGAAVAAFRASARRLAASPAAPDVVESLRRELHRMHGTAGTYGFAEASRLAAALEERVVAWAADPGLELEERAPIVERFADALAAALAAGSGDQPR